MIDNQKTICIFGGRGAVGITASRILSKLGYFLKIGVRNIEIAKNIDVYTNPNIQLFEFDIDKENNIREFLKGSDLVIGAIGPSVDYSEKMLLEVVHEII